MREVLAGATFLKRYSHLDRTHAVADGVVSHEVVLWAVMGSMLTAENRELTAPEGAAPGRREYARRRVLWVWVRPPRPGRPGQ